MHRFLPALLLTLSLTACWEYRKPRVDIELTNKSHEIIKNIEVDYPGGSYGIPSIDIYGVHRHTADIDHRPCLFTVKFEDSSGHAMGGKQADLGNPCPSKISILVNAQMAVSAEPGR